MNLLKQLFAWFGKLLSSSGEASSKRFNATVVVIAAIMWLSFDLHNNGMTDRWVLCYQTLVGATLLGYVGGVALGEKKKKEPTEGDPQ